MSNGAYYNSLFPSVVYTTLEAYHPTPTFTSTYKLQLLQLRYYIDCIIYHSVLTIHFKIVSASTVTV